MKRDRVADIDHLDAEAFSALGSTPIVWIDVAEPGAAARAETLSRTTQAIIGGIDRGGECCRFDVGFYDLVLTSKVAPAAPWISVADPWKAAESITAAVVRNPIAASATAQVLRMGGNLPFEQALQLESFAYSTLLGGAEFRAWRAAQPNRAPPESSGPYLHISRDNDLVTVTFARPAERNGICAGMRDALHEAICAVLDDPSAPALVLKGDGACFSTGGDLAEFGTATDLAAAHAIRTLRSCALRLYELGDRATVMLHGACIGSGIEIPAAAAHRHALPGAFFQLPELGMGLMPGAGGTVSIARAIGRHRTCYMVLSGRRITAETAAHWGLVSPVAITPEMPNDSRVSN
ncbi:enoyl-CoA hydratase/isomerase family protein (plasmid) [Sphingomonas paeninsulae]|uniref:Enoyl-CoA hydratase/isomerase family protein n=1 Tax=Sphingomonas paeninsulae TaxID=2319844 RepID=A0A494T6V8_SPHPE|nr:enoyl-CoA hydratase/isomerase family protein [Sphingomonas paeninsulae]AYJ85067.1 enoyl-CoA hydratase/isomerase family protein [Sphingomonas paeninsulae]